MASRRVGWSRAEISSSSFLDFCLRPRLLGRLTEKILLSSYLGGFPIFFFILSKFSYSHFPTPPRQLLRLLKVVSRQDSSPWRMARSLRHPREKRGSCFLRSRDKERFLVVFACRRQDAENVTWRTIKLLSSDSNRAEWRRSGAFRKFDSFLRRAFHSPRCFLSFRFSEAGRLSLTKTNSDRSRILRRCTRQSIPASTTRERCDSSARLLYVI